MEAGQRARLLQALRADRCRGACLRRLVISVALVLASGSGVEAAAFPTHYRFRSLSTERLTVHFHQGLEARARLAAALATELLEAQQARYGVELGRVHIVLSDDQDNPNGFATPLPYPLVSIRAVAPDGTDSFGNYGSWLRLALSHELAHLVHLEQTRGLLRAGRWVFGRAPFLVPNALTPTWMLEGLATYEETEATAFGRGRDPDSRMVLRMAALEDDFPGRDRPVLGHDRWPGGHAPYLFGEAFLRHLQQRFGPRTLPELTRVHSGRVLPFLDELTAYRVTQATFGTRWREWAQAASDSFHEDAQRLHDLGLSLSHPLTDRGVLQTAPRFSPDGSWIAYTSRALTRYRQLRLVRPDGTGDRKLAERNGGAGLSWTPDGRHLVFEELEAFRHFAMRYDLRSVEVATGRVRKLTHGLRAREPDVAPDGSCVVFVRRLDDRSELFVVGLDGDGLERVTRSLPGVQWSGPRWSPSGDQIVASRWSPGGQLDLVRVGVSTRSVESLTHDRAKDVEPSWSPDGSHVIFRSDRDGTSNLYALRLGDGTLLRITRVLGGAFAPDLSPDGRTVAFSSYAARGYDVHVMDVDFEQLSAATPFVDPYPQAPPTAAPVEAVEGPYRPFPTMLPRFWSPYVGSLGGEWRYGAASGGADPLLRHAYALAADVDRDMRFGVQGFYQYDRFLPTFVLSGQRRVERVADDELVERRQLTVRASLPIRSSVRQVQSLSLAWRRERDVAEDEPEIDSLDLGGLELGWSLSTAKRYPYSISRTDGWRLRVSYLKEAPALGSDVSLGKISGDARLYQRLSEGSQVLALRAGAGTTAGRPSFTDSFAVGGFPSGGLFDLVDTNQALLRGYRDNAFSGRSFVHGSAEYRLALGHPQWGLGTLPFFLRHLHGAVFADAAHAWSEGFRLRDVKGAAGVALGADLHVGHALPFTVTAGLARGFSEGGETQLYFRAELAF